ncbi:unnamed protein product [Ixodes persulcatus]
MYPSNVHSKLHISTSPKDQPLLTLRFPKKLWRIVNECRSGAITWSGDGSAVVIDYSKFQSDYLDNRLDIFKTSNITSFIRQLNLYGFRKVSPQAKLTPSYELSVAAPKSADVHVFRNDSFVRGRPDLLQGVARKTGALRARMMHRKSGAQFSASSSGTGRSLLDRARMMHSQGRHISTRHRQMLLRRAFQKQRSASSRSSTSSASGSADAGPEPLLPGGYEEAYEDDMSWYSQESSTDTSSSEEEYEHVYPAAEDVVADVKVEPGLAVESSIASQVSGWPIDYGATAVDGVCHQATSSFSTSPSPSSSGCGDMLALLDPSKSPKVVLLHQGRDQYELNCTPPLEDSFMLDPVVGHMGETLDSNLYYIFMTEDEGSALEGAPSVVTDGGDILLPASGQNVTYEHCNEGASLLSSTVRGKDSMDSYYCI